MNHTYRQREIEAVIKKAVVDFPIVLITGARQTGKSTLLRQIFPEYNYITLDHPSVRVFAKRDPEMFLESQKMPLVIDEIQYAPELLPFLKIEADKDRSVKGRFILTGSQFFPLMSGVTESLAGRVSVNNLYPFSFEEAYGVKKEISAVELFEKLFQGFYPEPSVHGVDIQNFYASYLNTYLERDIRQLLSVHDISSFQSFIELLAARAGSLLNQSEIARESGTSVPTVKRWLSLLESTEIIYLLRPYHRNISKRVVKTPKLYFSDTGLLAHILRYPTPETLLSGPMSGHLFENFIVMEILKQRSNRNLNFEIYFYRDSNGQETDIVLDQGIRQHLLEIKLGKNINPSDVNKLERIQTLFPNSEASIVSLDEHEIPHGKTVKSIHWQSLNKLLVKH